MTIGTGVASANCHVAACGGGLFVFFLAFPPGGPGASGPSPCVSEPGSTRAVREDRAGDLQGVRGGGRMVTAQG